MGVSLTEQELEKVLRLLDENDDGEVFFLVSSLLLSRYLYTHHYFQLDFEEFASIVRAEISVQEISDEVMEGVITRFTQALRSSEQGLQNMRQIFDLLDKDGSGSLNQQELSHGLGLFGLDFCEDEYEVLMKLIDSDQRYNRTPPA